MSFENGYEATAYIDNCIRRYKQDSLVFYKFMQILSTFSSQSSWPHNFDRLKQVSETILGDDIESILRFTGQALAASAEHSGMRQIQWPKDLPDNFKEDLFSFYYSIESIIEQAYFARTNPLRYFGVARSQSFASETKILTFLRMDGKSFELEMSKGDVKSLLRTLEIMVQDSCELK